MNNEKIFCVIPAYNEEKTIVEVLKNVKHYVDEVVVVDDGSTDMTYELANKQDVTVLKHLINRGQGASLETGTQYSLIKGADIIVHFDADGQFLASEIENVANTIKENDAQVVFGSRFLNKKSEIPWLKKYIIIPLARIVNLIFLGVNLTDPQSGFRALSREVAQDIEIEQGGMAHCSEILYKIFKNKYKFKEVPITVIYHNFGQRFTGGLKIIKDLLLGRLIS